MIRARHVSLALALAALVAFSVGTGGVSSTTAERGVSIAIVDDERAYLGIEAVDTNATSGEEITLFRLTNRFDHELSELDGAVMNDDMSIEMAMPATLAPGASGPVNATFECTENTTEETIVQIEVAGDGVSVVTNETVTVECTTAEISTPSVSNQSVNSTNETATSPQA